jgi:hypothetical protein
MSIHEYQNHAEGENEATPWYLRSTGITSMLWYAPSPWFLMSYGKGWSNWCMGECHAVDHAPTLNYDQSSYMIHALWESGLLHSPPCVRGVVGHAINGCIRLLPLWSVSYITEATNSKLLFIVVLCRYMALGQPSDRLARELSGVCLLEGCQSSWSLPVREPSVHNCNNLDFHRKHYPGRGICKLFLALLIC